MDNLCMRLLFIVHPLSSSCFFGGGFPHQTLWKQKQWPCSKEQCGRINRREQDVPWIMALDPSSPGDMLHNSSPWWTLILFIYLHNTASYGLELLYPSPLCAHTVSAINQAKSFIPAPKAISKPMMHSQSRQSKHLEQRGFYFDVIFCYLLASHSRHVKHANVSQVIKSVTG